MMQMLVRTSGVADVDEDSPEVAGVDEDFRMGGTILTS